MKKTFIMVMIFFGLATCTTNDDDPPRTNRENLIGTWNVTNIVYQNTLVGTIEPDVTGTIIFSEDGTGRENYTYAVVGITIPNVSTFTWTSTNSQIVFDENTNEEAIWERLQNSTSVQVGQFNEATGNTTITITLEK